MHRGRNSDFQDNIQRRHPCLKAKLRFHFSGMFHVNEGMVRTFQKLKLFEDEMTSFRRERVPCGGGEADLRGETVQAQSSPSVTPVRQVSCRGRFPQIP